MAWCTNIEIKTNVCVHFNKIMLETWTNYLSIKFQVKHRKLGNTQLRSLNYWIRCKWQQIYNCVFHIDPMCPSRRLICVKSINIQVTAQSHTEENMERQSNIACYIITIAQVNLGNCSADMKSATLGNGKWCDFLDGGATSFTIPLQWVCVRYVLRPVPNQITRQQLAVCLAELNCLMPATLNQTRHSRRLWSWMWKFATQSHHMHPPPRSWSFHIPVGYCTWRRFCVRYSVGI